MAVSTKRAVPSVRERDRALEFTPAVLCRLFRRAAEEVEIDQLDEGADFDKLYAVLGRGKDILSVDLEGDPPRDLEAIPEQTFLTGHADLLVPAYFKRFGDQGDRIARAIMRCAPRGYAFCAAFDAVSHQLFFARSLDGAERVSDAIADSNVTRRLFPRPDTPALTYLEDIISCTADADALADGIAMIRYDISCDVLKEVGAMAHRIADLTEDGDTDEVAPFLRLAGERWTFDSDVRKLISDIEALMEDPCGTDCSILDDLRDSYLWNHSLMRRSGVIDILKSTPADERAEVAGLLKRPSIAMALRSRGNALNGIISTMVRTPYLRGDAARLAPILSGYIDTPVTWRPFRESIEHLVADVVGEGDETRRIEIGRAARFMRDSQALFDYKGIARYQLANAVSKVARTYAAVSPRDGREAKATIERLLKERTGHVLNDSLYALQKTAEAGLSYQAFSAVAELAFAYKGDVSREIMRHIGNNIEGMNSDDVVMACSCIMRGRRSVTSRGRRGRRDTRPPYGAIKKSLERLFPSKDE